MPNFAILDNNNNVINVIVADDINDLSSYGKIIEDKENSATIGSLYDADNDKFIDKIEID